ncbi:hypothetical protein PLANPX_1313 [Lacipirellula parvula]|uniref:Uncharacterized protein n=1 Tax=Lacipirellula parvula TaxID=2650471 RepID=A0A5K7XAD5_9BACT|nr:hypothetical protein PLANPX_1313 [Lacipirellula parvula]
MFSAGGNPWKTSLTPTCRVAVTADATEQQQCRTWRRLT